MQEDDMRTRYPLLAVAGVLLVTLGALSTGCAKNEAPAEAEKTTAAPAQTTQQEPVYTRDDPGAWEGKEKGHLPQISYEKTGTGLKVAVVVNHVMNAEAPHYIMWIRLTDGEGNELGKKEFQPTDEKAEAVFELTSMPAKLVAFEKCNVHGIWKEETVVN